VSIPTDRQIKTRALEIAQREIGIGRITRVGESLLTQCHAAMREAIDQTVIRALAQHKRTSKTLGAAVCAPIPPSPRRRPTK